MGCNMSESESGRKWKLSWKIEKLTIDPWFEKVKFLGSGNRPRESLIQELEFLGKCFCVVLFLHV